MASEQMENLLDPKRLARLDEVLGRRTRNLTLFLENVHDPHNAAACLRSAEAFGIQDVYVVEGENRFEPSRRVVQGADKWLHLRRFEETRTCLDTLRARGYRVFVSDLRASRPLDEIDVTARVALAFGTERDGASDTLLAGADGTFIVPMRGFAQSFNVSVAVALSLSQAVRTRSAALGPDGDLPPEERELLRREWLRLALKRGDEIERAFARMAPPG